MRQAGVSDAKIAAQLGITRKLMWKRISAWTCANPSAPIPRPMTRPATPFYKQAAALARQGMATRDVATRLGLTEARTKAALRTAREKGLLPSRSSRRDVGGMTTYQHYLDKDAAPRLGHIRDIINTLTTAEVEALLRAHGSEDVTLADTIARALKGFLHEPR